MKTKYIGMLTVMAMLSLTACNNKEDLPQEPAAEGMPICFQVTTGDMQNHASHSNADPIQGLGVRIKSNDGNIKYTDENLYYAFNTQDSKWGAQGESVPGIWNSNLHTVNIIGFWPDDLYAKTENPFTISKTIKVLPDDETYSCDFMIAKKYNFDPATLSWAQPGVELEFQHVMSQLQVEIIFPEGTTPEVINTLKDINITGTNIEGTLTANKEKDMVTATQGTEGTVTVKEYTIDADNRTASFNCILIPQALTSGKLNVSFGYDGGKCKWASNQEITLKENTIHKLQLTVKKADASTQSTQSRSWGGHTAYEVIFNSMN